jgi:hypothetical protein
MPTVSTLGSFGDVSGGPLVFRNKIINGNFDIWQRGTSQTSSGYGSDDRWSNEQTGSTKTHTRQTFTVGQTDVPNNPKYFSRTVVTSSAGSSNYCFKAQKIESVLTFSGSTATLSFWAKADASKNIAIEFVQFFGTGGSPSSVVTGIGVTACALTTSWKKFIVTVNIPSISGKTLGTAGDDFISFNFWFDAGSSFNLRTNSLGQQSGTFDIAQVQLEAGSAATPFEERPLGLELALCQRYFFQFTGLSSVCTSFVRTSTIITGVVSHPVEMRASPVVASNATTSNLYVGAEYGSGDASNLEVAKSGGSNSSTRATAINASNVAASLTVGQGGRIAISNASAYISFSAEL